jgi:hypothetical protein
VAPILPPSRPPAKFAPVANLEVYRALHRTGLLGNYHLLIATEVVKAPNAWMAFWGSEILEPPFPIITPFIIMDNGLIETGRPTDPETLVRAASTVGASCVVLPDVLGDMEQTLTLARQALDDGLEAATIAKLGVVQGQTQAEVMHCVSTYSTWGVKYISVPRVMVSIFGSRVPIVRTLYRTFSMPIHLLGFSENIDDDMRASAQDGVMGIDSATPIWRGLIQHEFLPHQPPITANFGKRPPDYWTRGLDPIEGYRETVLIERNLTKVRQWMRDASAREAEARAQAATAVAL